MSDISRYFSQNYKFATARFLADAKKFGEVKMYSDPESEYVVPVLKVGNGPNKVVINTGIHGTEGFFGSAFFSRWLENGAKFLDKKYNEKFTVALVHVINGFGMEHYVRENANNVDLNRNFCDWAADAPKNYMYRASHDLLVSKPGLWKLVKLLWFR
ncbi:MAG: M14 family metallopeptidase, partial [Prevotellaceae bacterium]|nr:M14 family metallopeptidase [Prevotellaceae bacterium]